MLRICSTRQYYPRTKSSCAKEADEKGKLLQPKKSEKIAKRHKNKESKIADEVCDHSSSENEANEDAGGDIVMADISIELVSENEERHQH